MKKLYITFLAIVLALAMIVSVGVVNAGSGPITVSGEILFEATSIPGGFTISYQAGGNFVGTATEQLKVMDITPKREGEWSPKVSFVGIQYFVGTLWVGEDTYTGAFTARVHGQGRVLDEVKETLTIISGEDDLANLHGHLILMIEYDEADSIWIGTYSGTLHFAP